MCMTGWREVVEIVFYLIVWFLILIYIVPKVKGGFS